MKKNIEWLKAEIEKQAIVMDKGYIYTGDLIYLINKLDEPESLSHELPVIPKYVAEWITKHRDTYDLYPALRTLEYNTSTWEQVYKWYRENTHEFVNAYLTGEYEVEEETLYYALIKGHELVNDEGEWSTKYWNLWVSGGCVFPSDKGPHYDDFLTTMSKEEWSECGINDTNADFIKVEEIEE